MAEDLTRGTKVLMAFLALVGTVGGGLFSYCSDTGKAKLAHAEAESKLQLEYLRLSLVHPDGLRNHERVLRYIRDTSPRQVDRDWAISELALLTPQIASAEAARKALTKAANSAQDAGVDASPVEVAKKAEAAREKLAAIDEKLEGKDRLSRVAAPPRRLVCNSSSVTGHLDPLPKDLTESDVLGACKDSLSWEGVPPSWATSPPSSQVIYWQVRLTKDNGADLVSCECLDWDWSIVQERR